MKRIEFFDLIINLFKVYEDPLQMLNEEIIALFNIWRVSS